MLRYERVTAMRLVVVGLSAVLVAPVGIAATLDCATGSILVEPTTPTERFEYADELANVVVDKVTGLMWMRCPWGSRIAADSRLCKSDSSVDGRLGWKDAVEKAQDPAGNGTGILFEQSGWRLPNIKELGSIVEHGCNSPSINKFVFPGTPSEAFWTSSPITVNSAIVQAWAVEFGEGSTFYDDAKYEGGNLTVNGVAVRDPKVKHFVRFVRNAP